MVAKLQRRHIYRPPYHLAILAETRDTIYIQRTNNYFCPLFHMNAYLSVKALSSPVKSLQVITRIIYIKSVKFYLHIN